VLAGDLPDERTDCAAAGLNRIKPFPPCSALPEPARF
jgi:hypothetical protein